MKVLPAVMLFAAGVALLTFAALAFAIHPRPLSMTGPTGLVIAIGLAGAAFAGMASRHFHRFNKALRSA